MSVSWRLSARSSWPRDFSLALAINQEVRPLRAVVGGALGFGGTIGEFPWLFFSPDSRPLMSGTDTIVTKTRNVVVTSEIIYRTTIQIGFYGNTFHSDYSLW